MNRRSTRPSSTAWTDYHRRADAVRHALERISADPGQGLPWDHEAAAAFADRSELLAELHGVWTRRVLGRVEADLETSGLPSTEVVVAAWQQVALTLPELRGLLDQHADDAAVARCEAAEHRMLAVAAGLATLDDPALRSAALGRTLVETAREQVTRTRPERGRWLWLHPFRRGATAPSTYSAA